MHIHLPELEAVDADQLPESVRGLLSHDMDMTGVLEARHKSVIHLEVLQKQVLDREMRREVVLRTERGEAAEYGAIRIYLEEFPPNAQSEIVDGERPLGTIMKQHAVRFVSRPVVFFKLQADDLLSKLFTQPLDAPLFGRLNRLSHRTGGVLADVVEILPLEFT
ncbi:MAG: hypothetical protein KDC35_20960 [Acidobacteria bacterium]|nr:hypothetical protein [Acidobacteriota bacterium]